MHSLSEVAEYKSEGCCAEEEVIPAFSLDQLSSPRPPTQRTTGRPALALKGEPVVVTYLFRHPPRGAQDSDSATDVAGMSGRTEKEMPAGHRSQHPRVTHHTRAHRLAMRRVTLLSPCAAPLHLVSASAPPAEPRRPQLQPLSSTQPHPSSPTPPAQAHLSTTLALPDDLLFPEDCQR